MSCSDLPPLIRPDDEISQILWEEVCKAGLALLEDPSDINKLKEFKIHHSAFELYFSGQAHLQ